MEALGELRGLDLVIGGFSSSNSWKEYVGFTARYFEDGMKHVMAAPPGENGCIKRLDEFLYQKRPLVVSPLHCGGIMVSRFPASVI